ncbi:arylamine N-acetyltransferase [Arsenicitalea aurantiaca]|uniref:Arylamine N-acetyltransferase n=1 Tax=Arsenicitalea aurantiaca TaxID=1783274 RepID=A0A433X8H0_9HYPH|nr:arylamine N-acetyltransferase [Arsenicitalea aurantiaca]RUT30338.1 arylamine N-acetyltransferase [Arsenicitalea aurantiaca]
MSEDAKLNAYLDRVGFAGSIAPNLSTLQALHLAHPTAIAFENIEPLVGRPVLLDRASIEQKLVAGKRGGYCYEQNLLFMRVLKSLGYTVTGLAARILWNRPEGAVGQRSHMAMAVELGGTTYLADVGFGGLTLTAPLKLKTGIEQETPHETFRITGEEPVYRLEALVGEEWRPLYQFETTEQFEIDYEAPNWFQSTHPSSRFKQRLVVARPGRGRRLALDNNHLTIHTIGGETERRELESVIEIREVLSSQFGIVLGEDAAFDAVMGELLDAEAAAFAQPAIPR